MADITDFPKQGDDKPVSLRNSGYARFDLSYAAAIKSDHPDIWSAGGNIKGNAQFEILSRVARQGGKPATRAEEKAVRLREAWAARHYQDHRLPGVVAQMKWLVVGTLGEQGMKDLMNAEKDKTDGRAHEGSGRSREEGGYGPQPGGRLRDAESTTLYLRTSDVRAVRRETRPSKAGGQQDVVVVDFVASDESIDSHRSIVVCDHNLGRFQKNPVLLWAHNRDADWIPIGKCENTRIEMVGGSPALLSTAVFFTRTPFQREKAEAYANDECRMFSIGFDPGVFEIREINDEEVLVLSKNVLLEISAAPVGSNANALPQRMLYVARQRARAARALRTGGVSVTEVLETMRAMTSLGAGLIPETRGAIAYHGYPTADGAWDGDAAKGRIAKWASGDGSGDKDKIDWGKYGKAFAWVDPTKKEDFGGYKLPHHDVRDGNLVTIKAGVIAAGNAIQGARGGVDIPESDVSAVKAHLAKHYQQFDMTPPWEKDEKSARPGDHGETMNPKKTIEIEERAVRAKDGGMTCEVVCPHCKEPFEMAMKMAPMSPEKAAQLETRATTAENGLERMTAEKDAAEKRAGLLDAKVSGLETLVRSLRERHVAAEIDKRVGVRIQPEESEDQVRLAMLDLADTTPDPDKPGATLGEKAFTARLAKLDARRDLGLLGTPITAGGTSNAQATGGQARSLLDNINATDAN